MANNRKGIAETVAELISPTVNELGCYLWDVEYVKEGSRQILRVTIDKDDGVDIDDCEAVHRAIDPILDEADPIPVAYYLEVSSPGIERELRLPKHFHKYIGADVDVKLYTAVDGVKQFTGKLTAYDDESSEVTVDDKTLPSDKISKINLHYDFEK